MKNEIREVKAKINEAKRINDVANLLFEVSIKKPGIKMADLRLKITFKEKYFDTFLKEISEGTENIKEAEIKYNFKRINTHLEKILQEYTELVDELDEIIFEEEK